MGRRHFFLPPCPSNGQPQFSPQTPWLAPLAGYSDLPFRLLCRELGAVVCETEMISAKGLLYQSPGTGALLLSTPLDQPLVVQLFGGDAASMAQAVLILRKAGYVFFDCNMGCPVRKVLRQGAGAALMADPERAYGIARAMLAAARATGPDLPEQPARLGFKLRLPPPPLVLRDFALRLEELGADWLTIHPRYASQGYAGAADHAFTAQLAESLELPVIASGDLADGHRGWEILEQTGAACVMYARGALANPLVFRQHQALAEKREPPEADHASLRAIIERHIRLSREYDRGERAFVKIRSIIPRYVKWLPGVNALRQRLCSCSTWNGLESALDDFLNRAP